MEVIKIFACVIGENNYGILTYKTGKENYCWGTEENRKRNIERMSKKVKCLNDNKEFPSVTRAAKNYNISPAAISRSANQNIEVFRRNDKRFFRFSYI